jgi:hypothetical protein
MSVEVICLSCKAVGAVNRVTAGLRCSCGSSDVDLYDPAEHLSFLEFMGAAHGPGTGWGKTMPDPLKGWGEYAGPMPGANPFSAPTPQGAFTCPECKGSKTDIRDGGLCRACKGTGTRTPTTAEAPEPLVKRHNYPSTQTTTPFVGHRKRADSNTKTKTEQQPFTPPAGRQLKSPEEVIKNSTPGWATGEGVTTPARLPNISPHLKTRDDRASGELYSDKALKGRRGIGYPMHEANCPECGHAPTHLVNDYKDDAFWHCPHCGPLANIDRHPEIDPYNPPADFQKVGPRSFKQSGKVSSGSRGRVLAMLQTVSSANPGLTPREALSLVRATVAKYSE